MSEKHTDKSKENEAEKRHPVRGAASFLLMMAAVLLVVLLAAYRDGTGFDILRRYLHYGGTEKVGGETVYHYEAASRNRFATLGETLVVLSDASLSVLGSGGEEIWSVPVTMTAPALVSVIRALATEGAEIMAIAPFFPEYRPFVEANGAAFVLVPADRETFQIDCAALEERITARTQAVIVNSPNNPSGVIYTRATLQRLAEVLTRKSA